MRKITVVFGINDFLVGGMQRQLARQLRYYDRERFNFSIITLFEFPDSPNMYALIPNDIPVHRLAFRGFLDLGSWVRLIKLLHTLRPDIVVSSLYFSNTVFRILKPLLWYRAIAREHNTFLHKRFFERLIDRMLAFVSDALVAVSTTVADFTAAQEGIDRSRFRVIHNGIDLAEVEVARGEAIAQAADLRQKSALSGKRVLLWVGRLTPQKNLTLMIDAFAEFKKRHPDFVLIIVGDGSMRSVLETQAKARGLQKSVLFVGMQDDVMPYYLLSDVYFSTPTMEGFSNSILEALAFGLPVVSTATAGTDEIVREGHNGFFIREHTVASTIAALEKIAIPGVAATMKESCIASVQPFDIRKTVKKYESLFTEVSR